MNVLIALIALGAQSPEEPPVEDRLLPIPSVLRPKERANTSAMTRPNVRCKGALPARTTGKLPFGPGEYLSFETTLLGVRTGKIYVHTEDRELRDGSWTFPVRAYAKTESLFSVLGGLDGQMLSYVDVDALRPVRMANRFKIDRFAQPQVIAREDAAFSRDGRTRARLKYDKAGKTTVRPARLESRAPLFDPLSLVQVMRSLELAPGQRFCFEVYHRRALWRVEAATDKVALVTAPYGTKKAILVDARMRKVGSREEARDVSAWIGTTGARLPLRVRTQDNLGSLEVRLTGYQPGRRIVHE